MSTLWLVGMMGAGKTTVGWLVADRLGRSFVDLDDDVVEAAGESIPDIFAMQGETAFRALEHAALARRAGSAIVVACGGGVVVDERNVARMRDSGVVVWLDAPAPVLEARVGGGEGRPLVQGDPGRRLEELTAARRHLYEASAHARVDATGTPAEVADRVEAVWNAS